MKKVLIVAGIVFGSLAAMTTAVTAQVQAREASVSFGKVSQSAVVADFNYSTDALDAVLKKRFADAKLPKAKTAAGKFKKMEGATWTEISNDKMDYYYRLSGKKGKATLEIMASKGYDNFITAQNDASSIQNIKNFMASLESDLVKYSIEELMAAKEQEIKEAEKGLAKAEKALEAAKNDLRKQDEGVNKLRGELEKLKAQQ